MCQGSAFVSAPILVIAQIEALVVSVQGSAEEEEKDTQMPHFLEAPVGGEDSTTNNRKPASCDFLAEQIVLGKLGLFVESAKFMEAFTVKHHEHPCRERLVDARKILKEIAAPVEDFIGQAPTAKDVGSREMQLFLLHLFQTSSDQPRLGQLDISIQKQNIRRLRQRCAAIAAHSGHATG